MIRFLDRLILVAFALATAAATALVVALVGLVNQSFGDAFGALARLLGLTAIAATFDGRAEDVVAFVGQAAMTGLALWVGPIILVGVIGEAWGRRSWVFYAVGMALAFAAAPLATGMGLIGLAILYHAAAGLAAIGIAAGSVYWLIAGRSAGPAGVPALPRQPDARRT
ncbi:hypothetical protein [Labrys monachus]|uniref:Major facilitator superfamily (MFS) profile domain-containing protein n=1 Tax=Labrys monachus TaxID=217067 RepID=A0ABU0F8H4_9HYPH|nr:hypothetical protein [Labrys monachus]MDQ0390345.1 hypothetical protein [Labrys monachus]